MVHLKDKLKIEKASKSMLLKLANCKINLMTFLPRESVLYYFPQLFANSFVNAATLDYDHLEKCKPSLNKNTNCFMGLLGGKRSVIFSHIKILQNV